MVTRRLKTTRVQLDTELMWMHGQDPYQTRNPINVQRALWYPKALPQSLNRQPYMQILRCRSKTSCHVCSHVASFAAKFCSSRGPSTSCIYCMENYFAFLRFWGGDPHCCVWGDGTCCCHMHELEIRWLSGGSELPLINLYHLIHSCILYTVYCLYNYNIDWQYTCSMSSIVA